MKHLLPCLFLLIFVSSCNLLQPRGTNLRFVKVAEKEEVLIERKYDRVQKQKETQITEEESLADVRTGGNEIFGEERSREEAEKMSLDYRGTASEIEKIEPEEEEPTDQQKVEMAIQSEKQANASFYLFLIGMISVVLPLAGIILFAIGLSHFVKASNARFITPFGEERLRTAKIFLVIDAVILLFYISLILLLILLI
jgi:hypothetical protein